MTAEILRIVSENLDLTKEIKGKVDTHATELGAVKESMKNVKAIADNTGKMADALEKVTDRAFNILEGKDKRKSRYKSLVIVLLTLVAVIFVAAATGIDVSAAFQGMRIHAGSGSSR